MATSPFSTEDSVIFDPSDALIGTTFTSSSTNRSTTVAQGGGSPSTSSVGPTSFVTTLQNAIASSPTPLSTSSTPRHDPVTVTAGPNQGGNDFHLIDPGEIAYCSEVMVSWSRGAGANYSFTAFSTGPNYWNGATGAQNFTFWNWLIFPGQWLQIGVTDGSGATATRSFTVVGNPDVPCPSENPDPYRRNSEVPAQGAIQDPCAHGACGSKGLSKAAIAGIVIGPLAFAILLGVAFWFLYRRKYGPRRVSHVHPDDKSGDAIPATTGGASRSIWSTFTGRQGRSNNSLEDGMQVNTSTVRLIDDRNSPVNTVPSSAPLLGPHRTRRFWNGGPVREKGRSQPRRSPSTQEDTVSNVDSVPEDTIYSESLLPPSTEESSQSPFSDVHEAVIAAWNDMKHAPEGNSSKSDVDARQLSPSELEALADMVAARLNRRLDHSSATRSRDSHAVSEELPRYS